jgi:hypothetical protein
MGRSIYEAVSVLTAFVMVHIRASIIRNLSWERYLIRRITVFPRDFGLAVLVMALPFRPLGPILISFLVLEATLLEPYFSFNRNALCSSMIYNASLSFCE